MPRPRLIVLKFGGSVLLDESRMRIAVHEIYRWKREGANVVAVVSAIEGRTDELLACCDRNHPAASDLARAALLATGEQESAVLLALHLDRAGIPACALTPGALSFCASGPALNARPESIDTRPIETACARGEVVVFPGFTAHDELGRAVTLGRGGSDLTALFLASALNADTCRLIKDVDALYERDPHAPGPPPRRYTTCSYNDALATDGSIIQHKAVCFARDHNIPFELGAFNSTSPTTISAAPSATASPSTSNPHLSLTLLGHGVVGAGVAELVQQLPDIFDLTGVAVRNPDRHKDANLPPRALTTDVEALAASGADIVIETIGGTDTALTCARAALQAGAVLVTANKALLAKHADELHHLGADRDVSIHASASVGAALPVLESCQRLKGRVTSIRAVLNGTTNFILNELADGATPASAIARAQSLGLAEANPDRDLDGRDALDKVTLIARELGINLRSAKASCAPLEELAAHHNKRLRQIATLTAGGHASVQIAPVEQDDELFDLPGETNCVIFTLDDGASQILIGRGAGRWPTAEAILADLLHINRTSAAVDPQTNTTPEPCHA